MRIVTLLTDFGLDDYYVAALKGTLLRLAPGCLPVDLAHGVAPGDVEEAAFLLAAAAPAFPGGTLHLAVVDPGVGSARRILVAETTSALFVAPDNGLLTPFLASAGVRAVDRSDLFLPSPGSTFHGRDRFAPVAAALLRGEPPAALGPAVADPVLRPAEPPSRAAGRLAGRVVHVDRFGNLVTDIPSAWLAAAEGGCEVRVAGHVASRRVTHYAALTPGEAGVLPGSLGTLELSANGEPLARLWGVGRGAPVEVRLLP